jgi:hypothetical protein
MSDIAKALAVLGITGVVVKTVLDRLNSTRGLPYPPGPKAKPIIGNMLDIPQSLPWLTYSDWAKRYGLLPLHVGDYSFDAQIHR